MSLDPKPLGKVCLCPPNLGTQFLEAGPRVEDPMVTSIQSVQAKCIQESGRCEILILPHRPCITLCVSYWVIQEPTWPGRQLPSPVPRPILVLAAHRVSDFGSVPGQTVAPQPVPAGDSLSPSGKDTQNPDQKKPRLILSGRFLYPIH